AQAGRRARRGLRLRRPAPPPPHRPSALRVRERDGGAGQPHQRAPAARGLAARRRHPARAREGSGAPLPVAARLRGGALMPRYAAFLRGVMPTNLKMTDLRRCLEEAGFTEVATVLASGNAVFDARAGSAAAIERRVEAAMQEGLGRTFFTIVRAV